MTSSNNPSACPESFETITATNSDHHQMIIVVDATITESLVRNARKDAGRFQSKIFFVRKVGLVGRQRHALHLLSPLFPESSIFVSNHNYDVTSFFISLKCYGLSPFGPLIVTSKLVISKILN